MTASLAAGTASLAAGRDWDGAESGSGAAGSVAAGLGDAVGVALTAGRADRGVGDALGLGAGRAVTVGVAVGEALGLGAGVASTGGGGATTGGAGVDVPGGRLKLFTSPACCAHAGTAAAKASALPGRIASLCPNLLIAPIPLYASVVPLDGGG